MSTKAFCPCGGGSNLILGTGTENQIFILITSGYQVLSPPATPPVMLYAPHDAPCDVTSTSTMVGAML